MTRPITALTGSRSCPVLLTLIAALNACATDNRITQPPPPTQVQLTLVGNNQPHVGFETVQVDATLATADGKPVPNVLVEFAVTSGGGSLNNPPSARTGPDGHAIATWHLGESGNQSLEVAVPAFDLHATFSAIAVPPIPTPVSALSAWPDTNVIFTGMTRTLTLTVVRGTSSWNEPAESWSSSDASVAIVENGVVTAVGSGHATVTARLEDHVSPPIELFVVPAPSPPLRFSTGSGSCGLTTDGLLYCWNMAFPGMPGPFDRCREFFPGSVTSMHRCSEIPRLVSADLRFKALAGSCAVTVDGALHCWGGNSYGELGLGFKDDLTRGLTRVPTNDEFVEVTGGSTTRCARRIDGVILCWGSNFRGNAGIGSPAVSYSSAVVDPTPINTSVKFVKLGSGGNCGLATDSTAYCWGSFVGGDSASAGCNTGCSLSPVRVKSEKLVDFDTNEGKYCGIGVSGRAYCWGFHGFNPYRYPEPQEIPNPGFRSFEPGLHAIDGSGAAFKIDDYAALWRFRPLDTGELRYKRYFGDCGISLDDKLYCGTSIGPHGRLIPGQ
jgi:hypothetical protein